jgi:hypothetical protein
VWNYIPGTPRRYGGLVIGYASGPAGTDGVEYGGIFRGVAVFGNTGLTSHLDANGIEGFLASDILGYALGGTSLNFTVGDSIERSSFPIIHFAPTDRAKRRQVVEDLTALSANVVPNDWGVFENREFFHKTPGTYGRTWRVRKDQVATPTSDGPQSKERTGSMMITYDDESGKKRSVGPPGSGADFETATLLDTDPDNPAVRLGGRKRHERVGITSQQGAVNIGVTLLTDANSTDWRGSTVIRGEATDDKGNKYPPAFVRAGDRLEMEDDDGINTQPIISTSPYTQDDLAVTVNVGAPPHRGETLLAQLVAATDLIPT